MEKRVIRGTHPFGVEADVDEAGHPTGFFLTYKGNRYMETPESRAFCDSMAESLNVAYGLGAQDAVRLAASLQKDAG